MQKPHYGIDAPSAIKQLLIFGIFALIIGGVAYFISKPYYPSFAKIVLALFLIFFFMNLVSTILMVLSSLYGKLIWRDKIIKLLNLKSDDQVLDVGCGSGLLLCALAKKIGPEGKAIGLDLWSSEDLSNNQEAQTLKNAELEKVFNHIELVTENMTKMPFKDNQFDAIVSNMAIHNVPTKQERRKAIQEIARVLKPSGQLIISDFKYTKDYAETLRQLGWKNVQCSSAHFIIFPPVRFIKGIKPKQL